MRELEGMYRSVNGRNWATRNDISPACEIGDVAVGKLNGRTLLLTVLRTGAEIPFTVDGFLTSYTLGHYWEKVDA